MKKQGIYKKFLSICFHEAGLGLLVAGALFMSRAEAADWVITSDSMQCELNESHWICKHEVHVHQDDLHLYCEHLEAWMQRGSDPSAGKLLKLQASDCVRLQMREHAVCADSLQYDAFAQSFCLQGAVELSKADTYTATAQALQVDLKRRILRLHGQPKVTLKNLVLPELTP